MHPRFGASKQLDFAALAYTSGTYVKNALIRRKERAGDAYVASNVRASPVDVTRLKAKPHRPNAVFT